MNYDEMIRVLDEMLDAEITSTEGKRDNLYLSNWLRKSYEGRISLLRSVRARLKESVLVNHRHFAVTVVPEPEERFTLIKAELARLQQETRISERERLMVKNDRFIEDAVAELKDRFQQAVFEPPKPAEQTLPVQP